MTAVAFHFGAPDKLGYACRLLRKAVGSGAKVAVLGDASTLLQLDGDLWAVSATDFVTHCEQSAEPSFRARCAVVLARHLDTVLAPYPVLLNLTEDVPPGFDAFERVIEIVSTDDADRSQARMRWRRYTDLGYTITRHDLALKGAAQ